MSPEGTQTVLEQPVYLYGIVRAGGDPAHLLALDVATIEEGALAAVISRQGDEPIRPAKQARRHHAVLDALASRATVVPARFGMLLDDESDVRVILREESERWASELERVDGRRQFRVRALYDEERLLREVVTDDPRIAGLRETVNALPADAGHRERVRLGELVGAAVDRRRAEDRSIVLDAVLAGAADSSEHERGELDHVVDVFVLVDATLRGEFEASLEQLAAQLHPRIRLQLTGPMAPYEFVGGDRWG